MPDAARLLGNASFRPSASSRRARQRASHAAVGHLAADPKGSACTVPAAFLVLPNIPSRFWCNTEISCRNTALGVAGVGLVVAWLADVVKSEKPPRLRTELWAANLSMGLSQDGTPTWGVTFSH